ncbi:MAG: 3-phosphoshikimate 1-carboxyvinyltransferase, partial [Acidimicrobiia bacterium]
MRFSGPSAPFHATVMVPGDKSMSHRSLILAAMARGKSRIVHQGGGADVESTRAALRLFGVAVGSDQVVSPGIDHWTQPAAAVDAGNSATTMRLLAGAVAGRPFVTTFEGDRSLMSRPMGRLAAVLRSLGARVSVGADGRPPVTVTGAMLPGAHVEIPIPSAQLRTAVALAALQASGATSISSPPGYRDHTERWLAALGLGSGAPFVVNPGAVPPLEIDLPADSSSAAFLWVSAAVNRGSTVLTERVTLNPGRIGLLAILKRMGAEVTAIETGRVLGDPVGDVEVAGSELVGVEVRGVETVQAIDELPALAVAAAHAVGPTVVADAAELRAKETDRIAAIVAMVRGLGGHARDTSDGFEIEPVPLTGGTVDSRGDHRIAMAAAVAAGSGVEVEVDGFGATGVSWPGFEHALEAMWSS